MPDAPARPPESLPAIFREVLEREAQAILEAARRLDERLIAAVDLVLSARGRLIVSGIGKSGLVGRKISATLSSTGTPSFFLHPTEALHGDLGMVTEQDVVLVLSNSGETEEIVRLIPFLRRLGARIIALVGTPGSTIARMADVALDTSVEREACPLNLAPTSSTTVTMAMGDALAVALLEARGFKEKDFARLHPSGSLGRRFLTVRDLMHTGDRIPAAPPEMTLKDGIIHMSRGGFGTLVITDPGSRLLGIFTDGDLRRLFERQEADLHRPLRTVMTPNPRRIGPDRLAMEALKLMEEKAITSLVVVDPADTVIGFLHLHDILRSRLV
ncbi:MAG: Arabinose 5-phosphate isomerase [Candidatus Ozemobacter sibiricus]|jgi:arabinose-5-phosphate isomerase|uniref:Arabinose 5-phosphate isomerase n=1 Tax=Candidatus Ozemobacter sibiricus TaxID=2268124 RepID=A0A367ZR78_9BACT|nr:MAG: Arabinose 5-phosphate isomerase [Candidatus Ozemobacter sibiricus]